MTYTFRYFADETGKLLGKSKYRNKCIFSLSNKFVDDARDLKIDQWQIDLATNTLVEITNE